MDRGGPEPHEISRMLADDIVGVIAALKIDVETEGRRRYACYSPWNSHKNPKLEIDVDKKPGKWNDWIEGQYGDALSLVACTLARTCDPKNKKLIGEALKWARDYLKIGDDQSDDQKAAWKQRVAEAEARAKRREAAAARELAGHRRTAQGLWLAARPLTLDDAGAAYLKARRIDLALLPRMPRAIRFSLEQPWYDEATGEIAHVGPALMSAMTLPDGAFASLHRTWIDPTRPGEKAELTPARKMWPASEGAAIRLWRGESGLSARDAGKAGAMEDVVACEGVEDGLSIVLMAPELRVDAVGSLPGLLSYTPYKFTRAQIIAADNDWGKPQAQALLTRACRRLQTDFGKIVRVARSPEGKDFNDLLRGV